MKKQLFFQKLIVLIVLITLVAGFVTSLGLTTTLALTLRKYAPIPHEAGGYIMPDEDEYVAGSEIIHEIQPFNKTLIRWSLISIVVCLLLFLSGCNKRRKYYIGNYVATGIVVASNLAIAVYALVGVFQFRTQYLTTVDFEKLDWCSQMFGSQSYISTLYFDLCLVAFVLVVLASVALVVNSIWKFRLLKHESTLLSMGNSAVSKEANA